MSRIPRVIFLGNHTVGVRSLQTLVKHASVVGVIAHPVDPEDGVRYCSVFFEAKRLGIPVIRSSGKSEALKKFIQACVPDLLWIADYRYLLPECVLEIARFGAINLHPSLLPKYRGRAPVNWAILHGETQLGLTAHWVDAGMDTGDIIAQRSYHLRQDQDVADALAMLYPIYESVTADVLQAFQSGNICPQKQREGDSTAFPRRTPADGLIDWGRPANAVWNLIRAVAPPYPGAFAPWRGGVLRVYRVLRIIPFPTDVSPEPGSLVEGSISLGRLVVACADSALEIVQFVFETDPERK